jgi:hypothetical protein
MASFFDLKGTSLQYFYVGLKKLKFDSSALTQERIFYLPDATVTMTGGNIGEVLGITGANDIGWVSNGGGGSPYADINISALDIDWSLGTTYYKNISANSTFTFSNIIEGKTITVIITNTTVTNYVSSFPTTNQAPGGLDNNLYANSSTVYTFTRSNGITYCNSFSGVI